MNGEKCNTSGKEEQQDILTTKRILVHKRAAFKDRLVRTANRRLQTGTD